MTSLAIPNETIQKQFLNSTLEDKWTSLKKKRYEEYTLAKLAREEARGKGADSRNAHAEEHRKLLRFGLVANISDELERSRDASSHELNLQCYEGENKLFCEDRELGKPKNKIRGRLNPVTGLLERTAEMSKIIKGLREDVCAYGNQGFENPMPLQARYRLAECDFYDDCVNVFRRKIENRTLTEEDYSHIEMFFEKFNKDPSQRFPQEGFSL